MKMLAGVVLAVLMAVPVSAGGQRTVVVPPLHVGDTFTANGCGYTKPEVIVYLYREGDPKELSGGATPVGPDGCFSQQTGYVFATAGSYEVSAYQIKGSAGSGSYNQNHPSAYLDFTVLP